MTHVGRALSLRRAIALAVLVTACSSDASGPGKPVVSVQIGPPVAQLQVGTALQMNATPRDADDNPLTDREVAWASANPAVATVTASGLVTGVAPGATTIRATSEGVNGSADLTVVPGPPTQLVFTLQPSTTPAGAAITPAVQVTARDALGFVATSFTGTVTVAIGTNPAGGVLSGTTSRPAVAGVATFNNLTLDKSGTGYTLTASAGGLPATISTGFNVTPATVSAAQSTVSAAPATIPASSGTSQSTITVTARDAFGNPISGATVVLAATGTGNTLTQPVGTTNASGVATGTLSATVAEAKTVSATINGTGITQTAAVTVQAAAVSAAQSTVSAAPATITASTETSQSTITVTARDQFSNPISGATVVLAATGTGNTLTQPGGTTNASGVATGTLSSTVAQVKTVSATISAVAITQTATVTVNPAAATQLAFTVQPSATPAGAAITPAVQVTARDALGNTVTSFTGTVTVAIGTNPAGGVLSGTTSRAAVAGIATFNDLAINQAGNGYTLTASAPGLTGATSAGFNVTAATVSATLSTVSASPTTITASNGTSQSTITVTARNALGNPVSGATVVLAATGTGNTLTQPASTTNASGVATGTISSTVAEAKTVSATISGVAITQTATVTVSPGSASVLAFTVHPANTTAGATITPAIQVAARDAFGNTVTSYTAQVTVDIGTNPAGGTLSGTNRQNAVAGVATFSNLSINNAGTGYTLVARQGSLTNGVSNSFNITAGAVSASQSTVSAAPTTITASNGTSQSTITATAKDAFGNPISGATVTLAATGTGNTLTQPVGTTNASGVATGTLSSTVAQVKTVSATINGTAITQTAAVTVQAAGVSAALSTVSAATDSIGQCLSPCDLGFAASRITVTVRDQLGNPVAGAAVTLSAASADSNVFANPGATGVTDATGVFRADFSSGQATAKILSAVAAGTPLSQTATVHVMPALIGAGDIADCNRLGDDATANQLDGMPGTVFALGDDAYPNGRTQDFANCYDPTWGRHRTRTRPAPGNHDYDSSATAAPYFAYFGAAAGTAPNGYYSYDAGAWHVVVLNDNVPMTALSPQVQWLRADLNGRRNQCVLAYWHRPRYSSGSAGNTTGTQALWQALADSAADIVLWGHDHDYERFAPMDAAGGGSATGIRAFVVGTGGGEDLGNGFPILQPNSVVRDNTSRGVLRLTLYEGRYRWEFIPAPGFGSFTDSGSGNCN